jgi:hypothetical protein
VIEGSAAFFFAHAGHVLIDLPIFMGPVLAITVWLAIANWRDKRSGRSAASTREAAEQRERER